MVLYTISGRIKKKEKKIETKFRFEVLRFDFDGRKEVEVNVIELS